MRVDHVYILSTTQVTNSSAISDLANPLTCLADPSTAMGLCSRVKRTRPEVNNVTQLLAVLARSPPWRAVRHPHGMILCVFAILVAPSALTFLISSNVRCGCVLAQR